MTDIKGTKTEKNLFDAFVNESKTRNKYTLYAAVARKDGYDDIAAAFEQAADNEKEHARVWLKLLNGGELPFTEDNLNDAIEGERFEGEDVYSQMAETAKDEGFDDIAFLFRSIKKIEKEHENTFRTLLDELKGNTINKNKNKTAWVCKNCGYMVSDEIAPGRCSVCGFPQDYFEKRIVG